MNNSKIGRRTFLQGVSLAALGAAVNFDAGAQVKVPNSSGTELPTLKAPARLRLPPPHLRYGSVPATPVWSRSECACGGIPAASAPYRDDTEYSRDAPALYY